MSVPVDPRETEPVFRRLLDFAHVGLAVSGGPDSLALMHLVAAWRDRAEASPHLTVLTVDHGLRPSAAAEASLVAAQAASLGLPHATLAWTGPKPARGIEAAARQARYDLMAEHCHRHGIGALVTAHHLDDQAETLLMRLARGSGVDGLAAMRSEGSWAGIRVLRPLLDLPKARLVATARALNLPVAADATNRDARFERARLRGAAPTLDALGLTPAALARTAKRLRRAADALDGAATDFLRDRLRAHATAWAELPLEAFRQAPEEVAIRALGRILAAVGARPEPPRLGRLEALAATLRQGRAAKGTLAGCRMVADGLRLTVMREIRAPGLPSLTLAPGQSALWDRRIVVTNGAAAPAPVSVTALGEAGLKRLREDIGRPAGPRAALLAAAAFWCEDRLEAVPQLGFWAGSSGPADYGASFANAELLWR